MEEFHSHSYSFFGQNTGLLVNSSSKYHPYLFMRCIKKKPNMNWEKPSNGEGRMIKFSLEEIISILDVLNKQKMIWNAYHSFKEIETKISFSWEDENAETLWINIANYSKMLTHEQTVILKLLLNHILKEKIEFATMMNEEKGPIKAKEENNKAEIEDLEENSNNSAFKDVNKKNGYKKNTYNNNPCKKTSQSNPPPSSIKKITLVQGLIKSETNKAVLIDFDIDGREVWIPKSTIHSDFKSGNVVQEFLIDNWVLKRNQVIM